MVANTFNVSFVIGAMMASSMSSAFKAAQGYLNKTQQSASQLNQKQAQLVTQQRALTNAVMQGVINLKSYQNAMRQVAVSMQQVKAAQEKLKFDELGNKRQEAMGDTMKWVGAAYAMATPIRDAMKFESAMADVKKVVDMTGDEFKGMSQDIIAMSTKIPMTAEEISKIVAAGGQAGIDKSELLGFAEAAAKMGVAFDISADQAGDMMAKWRTAFKMDQSGVVDLADKINYLGNTTAASADKISDVVTRIGPLGEVGGVASGEIAALGASMVSTGVESDVAATAVKNFILGMSAGDGATKAQVQAFQRLGFNATDMAKRMQTDAKGAIIDVLKSIQGLDKATQAATLQDLFGKESLGAIAPLLSNLDALEGNFQKVGDKAQYAGSMENEFATRSETSENALQLFDNATHALSIALGQALLPAITPVIQQVTELVKGFAEFMANNPNLAAILYAIAGGFTAIMIAVSIGKVAFFAYQQVMTGLRVAMSLFNAVSLVMRGVTAGMTAAQWLLNAAMSANPIGLVIIAIAGLIAIGLAMYAYWEEISAFCSSMWDSPAAAVIAFLAGPIGMLIYMVMGIIGNWEAVKQWFVTLWNDPGQALTQFCDMIRSKFDGVINWVADKWNWIKSIFSQPIQANVQASASGNGQKVTANAIGGIYKQGAFLTTFAEESPEAAIPIDGSPRAIALWKQTGTMLGMNVAEPHEGTPIMPELGNFASVTRQFNGATPSISNVSSNPIQANFAPTINVTGSGDESSVRAMLRDEMNRFKLMLEQVANDKRRKSYA